MRWSQILASASSIFFGFLLNIAINPPSYFTFIDNVILLAALYAVTVATAMFIMPVIFHASHYRQLDVERFLFRTKQICSDRYHLRNASYVLGFRTGFEFQATSSDCI